MGRMMYGDWIGEDFGRLKLVSIDRNNLYLMCTCGGTVRKTTTTLWMTAATCKKCKLVYEPLDKEYYNSVSSWKDIAKRLGLSGPDEAKMIYCEALAKLKASLPSYSELMEDHNYRSTF